MKIRLVCAALVAGALTLSHSAQAAGTPTLDGKKTKTLTATYSPVTQDHDSDLVTGALGTDDRVNCKASRCAVLPFVYAPAKGVKGDLGFSIAWKTPGMDADLYVVEILKDGSRAQVATCGATAGTSEKVVVHGSDLRAGKKYGLLVDFYRVASEKITATVTFPGTLAVKSLPTDAAGAPVGCGL